MAWFKYIFYNLLILFLLLVLPQQASATTYFVSPSGNDSNLGTIDQPWKTIQYGVNQLVAGDTLYVKSGTYLQTNQININRSGREYQPITIMTDPSSSSKAIISGDINGNKIAELEYDYWFLVYLGGSYIHFKNFEVEFSPRLGIRINGAHNIISGNNIHHTRYSGISVHGPNNIIERNTVWRTADYNCCPTTDNPYECSLGTNRQCNGDWPGGIAWGDTSGNVNPAPNIIIRHNVSYHNSGEGFLCMNTDGAIVEDNISYDNWALGIDIDQCSNNIIQRNLVYYSDDQIWWRGTNNPGHAIMLSNEGQLPYPIGHDRLVINNIIIGSNFRYWGRTPGSALINDLIANNTFIESQNSSSLIIDAPYDSSANHSNTNFVNNLVLKSSSSLANVATTIGLTFNHNLWSRTPPPNVYSIQTDIVGSPQLTAPTTPHCTLQKTYPDPAHPNYAYETLTCNPPEGIKLTSNSPAIEKGTLINNVLFDFFGTSRNNPPDIGAHEYTPSEPSPSPQPCPADLNNDEQVNYEDLVQVLSLWGQDCLDCQEDIHQDNKINTLDLAVVIKNWGDCP